MGKGDQCTVCEGAVNIISIFDLYYEYGYKSEAYPRYHYPPSPVVLGYP